MKKIKLLYLILFIVVILPTVVFAGQVHVSECDEQDNCRLTAHTPMPAGDNTAALSWQTVFTDAGIVTATSLTDTQISSATEKVDIVSGDVLELDLGVVGLLGVKNAGNLTQKKAAMDTLTDALIGQKVLILQNKHQWYGYQQPAQ